MDEVGFELRILLPSIPKCGLQDFNILSSIYEFLLNHLIYPRVSLKLTIAEYDLDFLILLFLPPERTGISAVCHHSGWPWIRGFVHYRQLIHIPRVFSSLVSWQTSGTPPLLSYRKNLGLSKALEISPEGLSQRRNLFLIFCHLGEDVSKDGHVAMCAQSSV